MLVTSPAPRIRRTVARRLKAAQPQIREVAALLLRSPFIQRALNRVEETAGWLPLYPRRDFRVSDLASFLFHTVDLLEPFPWRCRFAGTTFTIPIDPGFPHPPPHNDPWGPPTYWLREENRKIRQFYEGYLGRRPSGTFLDVGANFGNHSYPFAASGYRCISFEPQSICCDFIARIGELNGMNTLTVVGSVVGARCQSGVPFFESEVEAFSSMNEQHVEAFNVPWRQRKVDCVTLDSYCGVNRIEPTLIKIDTEGFECEVVRGALGVLREFKPGLVVEVSAGLDDQYELWRTLAREGYRCYAIVRSMGSRYPERPFVPIRTLEEFVTVNTDVTDKWEGERDFIFLQPFDDVLHSQFGAREDGLTR
jgi:FkbM family methyltransferase